MSKLEELSRLLASDDEFTQQKLADETGVILDVDSLRVFSLNETGMFLVECMKTGTVTEDGLVERLIAQFEVEEEPARQDVSGFVSELTEHLIEKRKKK